MRASKKVKGAVLLTAGAALFLGAPTVYANGGGDGGDGGNAGNTGSNVSSNNGGLLSGLQLLNNADLNVPVAVCGVGAILALGSGDCETTAGGNSGGDGGDGGSATSGKSSKSSESYKSYKSSKSSKSSGSARGGGGGDGGDGGSKGDNISRNNSGLLSGLQVGNNLSANVPVTACGVGALLARGRGDCDVTAGGNSGGDGGKGGSASSSSYGKHGKGGGKAVGGDGGNGGDGGSKGDNISRNNSGILTGAQVLNNADLNVPITLCGVALLAASAGCDADVTAGGSGGGDGGNGGGAYAGGYGRGGSSAYGGGGGDGGNGGSKGDNVSSNNDGILTGLQLLNNADLNIPVTVCGLAVLGRAGCEVEVSAGSRSGGDGGNGGRAITWTNKSHDHDNDGDHDGDHRATVVRNVNKLPHTGAAGLALIPFGLALVAGGVAMRRRAGSDS